jgi:2',3'-cyclic-nucleotide 2'-phosphodiesterase (5'-nucleotidase family)
LLSQKCPGVIDLILGGHDHHVVCSVPGANCAPIVKSGCDFRYVSEVELYCNQSTTMVNSNPNASGETVTQFLNELTHLLVVVRLIPVTAQRFSCNPFAQDLLNGLIVVKAKKLKTVIAHSLCPIDARASVVRSQESGLGCFLCDVMASENCADIALINAGSIRSDRVYPKGNVTVEVFMDIFPFQDPVVLLLVPAQTLLLGLENGVSALPALDGRFLQVSHAIQTTIDLALPVGHRVVSVHFNGAPLDMSCVFRVAMPLSMADGLEDSPFVSCERLVDRESGVLPSLLLRNFFAKQLVVQAIQLRVNDITQTAQRALAKFTHSAVGHVVTPRFNPIPHGRIVFIDKDKHQNESID